MSIKKVKICIIGAGISGLIAAKTLLLSKANLDVEVLEGSDYCGGRILTHTAQNGDIIEHGANYIHDFHEDNPLYDYCTDGNKQLLVKDLGFGNIEILANIFDIKPKIFQKFLDIIKDVEQQTFSSDDFNKLSNGYEKRLFLIERYRSLFKEENIYTLDSMMNVYFMCKGEGIDDKIAKDYFIYTDKYGESNSSDVLVYNGYNRIIKQILSAIPPDKIKKHSKVTALYKTESSMRVDYIRNNEQLSWVGDFVINTVPLGVLKAGTIKFSPELSKKKQLAIRNLEMAKFSSMSLTFNFDHFHIALNKKINPFKNPYLVINANNMQFFIVNLSFPYLPEIKSTSLRVIFLGSNAEIADSYESSKLKALIIKSLEKYYESLNEKSLVEYTYKSWQKDGLFCGSYSYLGNNGSKSSWIEYSMSEYDGHLLMAGEACAALDGMHKFRPSTVDGAMLSGGIAAIRLLQSLEGRDNGANFNNSSLYSGLSWNRV